MTVYIEYVLIDNFVIDYLLLKTTFSLARAKVKRGRLAVCATLGAAISLFYPLVEGFWAVSIPLKLCVGLLLVALARKHQTFREFYIDTLIFIALSFFTGGAIIGLFNMFNLPYSTEIAISIMFLPVYFVIKFCNAIINYFYRKKQVSSFISEVELVLGDKIIKASGFFDTGNGLYKDGNPLIVCDKRVFNAFLESVPQRVKLKKTSVNTVAGRDENFCFDLDDLRIYYQGKLNIFNNVTAMISKGRLGDDYQVILHVAFMEGDNDKFNQIKAKKVS